MQRIIIGWLMRGCIRRVMMDNFDVMRKVIDEAGGVKKVAAALGLSASTVYKWCQPLNESGTPGPLDRFLELLQSMPGSGGRGLLDHICALQGGVFCADMEAADCELTAAEYLSKTQQMIYDFSELLQVISESLENDGVIDTQEAAKIKQQWYQLKTVGEEFVHSFQKSGNE